jgi:hypothetical protein
MEDSYDYAIIDSNQSGEFKKNGRKMVCHERKVFCHSEQKQKKDY